MCGALPTEELRALNGKLDLGKDAWPEIFGNHQVLRHICVCPLPALGSLIPSLAREGCLSKTLLSLTLLNMDLSPRGGGGVPFIDGLKTGRPPKLYRKLFDRAGFG
jgi:hypothetical protein